MIRFSIRRPVAVTMAYVGLALLGVASWRRSGASSSSTWRRSASPVYGPVMV